MRHRGLGQRKYAHLFVYRATKLILVEQSILECTSNSNRCECSQSWIAVAKRSLLQKHPSRSGKSLNSIFLRQCADLVFLGVALNVSCEGFNVPGGSIDVVLIGQDIKVASKGLNVVLLGEGVHSLDKSIDPVLIGQGIDIGSGRTPAGDILARASTSRARGWMPYLLARSWMSYFLAWGRTSRSRELIPSLLAR